MIFKIIKVLTLGSILLLWSCGSKKNVENAAGIEGQVKIDGSSTVYPITEAVAEEFGMEHPKTKVIATFSGTSRGLEKFSRGEIDISDASRPIKEDEIKACETSNIKYVELKVGIDGLAVVVSKENTWLDNITVQELKKIWEPVAEKKIKKWSQIRSTWPDVEFHLFGAGLSSGTYDYFTEVIVGKSRSSRTDYTASENDNILEQGVAGDKNSLGFFGLAYYAKNKHRLKLVAIDNGKGPVIPTQETVATNAYSPLSRPLFIYVSRAAAKRKEVDAFVNFYLEKVPTLVKDVGYIPLTEKEYAEETQRFKDFLIDK